MLQSPNKLKVAEQLGSNSPNGYVKFVELSGANDSLTVRQSEVF